MLLQSSLPQTLLAYFRAHSGRVLTREELAREVWNLLYYSRSRVVDQTVSQIRKQLGPAEQIVTVESEGYRHQREEGR